MTYLEAFLLEKLQAHKLAQKSHQNFPYYR